MKWSLRLDLAARRRRIGVRLVRRRTQAHDLRRQRHRPVVAVGRPMMQRDVDAHDDLREISLHNTLSK